MRCLSLLLVLVCAPALAQQDSDADFRAWAKKRASALGEGVGIESWGVVQLDEDEALEHFAVLCAPDADSATVLVAKGRGARWSMSRDLDGRNACTPVERPAWSTKARRGYETVRLDSDGSGAQTFGLLAGKLTVLSTDTAMERSHEHVDFEALRRTRRDCDQRPCVTYASAVFLLGGASGTYRVATPHAPALNVTTEIAGKRAAISVALSQPAAAGDAVEIWSTTDGGRPMGWRETWSGAAWNVSGVGRAPKERPPVTGDATHLTVPIVRRDLDDEADGTALCIVWYSASRSEHASTCDLDGKGVPPFFFTMSSALYAPDARAAEGASLAPR